MICAGLLQASLGAYGVFKGEHYEQASASAPGAAQIEEHGVQAFAVTTEGFTPFMVIAEPGGTSPVPMFLAQLEGRPEFVGQQTDSSAATRDAYFPDGPVTFSLLDFETNPTATLTLATPALPPIPVVANYADTQAVDPSQPFTLRWSGFQGAGVGDLVWVQIESWNGTIFASPVPGAPGALTGSATEVVIPAGTLTAQEDIRASIGFFKVGQRTDGSLPGSTALTGSYRFTTVSLKLEGTGGPGDGPILLGTAPASGSFNVSPNTQVRFDFSRPMAPVADITWMADGAPLDSGLFAYSWSSDGFTLIAKYLTDFPPNAIITWSLGDGFEDTDGAPLEGELLDGGFLTGSTGGGGDCDEEDPFDEDGSFFLTRALYFQQTGTGTLVPHPEAGALFVAGFNPPVGMTVSGASLTPPSGQTVELQSFFGSSYFFFADFSDELGLNSAYPQGNYTARVQPATGSAIQGSVNASGSFPSTPQLLNHAAAQAIDPGTAFTLQWNAFSGANASSIISLEITDEEEGDTVFSAPNECAEIDLAPTATSIVVPANTLESGRVYTMTLSFFRITDTSEHAASGITFMAAHGASTETTLRTTGGTGVEAPLLGNVRLGDHGRFQATVTGSPGLGVIVQASSNLIDWQTVTTLNIPGSGSITFEDPNPLNASGGLFYRLRTL
jgi:hypothetical protein